MSRKTFKNRDILSIKDFTKEDLLLILDETEKIKAAGHPIVFQNRIMATCFFEPSTRTKLSFESAMHRLGGKVIGFSSADQTSAMKGESLYDSMKMLEGYADVIVLRHPKEGSAKEAAEAVTIPVINAGDGSNEHPTQTLLDLFSIRETQGSLEGLHIALAGDLKYGRTVHSLIEALVHFNCRLYFVSPPSLEIPPKYCDLLRLHQIEYSTHSDVTEILPHVDVLYMTRLQVERFSAGEEFERLASNYQLTAGKLKGCKENLKILHPLPRVKEIDSTVDSTPFAYYFSQAQNGVYTRQAILSLVL